MIVDIACKTGQQRLPVIIVNLLKRTDTHMGCNQQCSSGHRQLHSITHTCTPVHRQTHSLVWALGQRWMWYRNPCPLISSFDNYVWRSLVPCFGKTLHKSLWNWHDGYSWRQPLPAVLSLPPVFALSSTPSRCAR